MALLINTQIRNDLYATGSIQAAGGFTGSLLGTASWALNAVNGGTTLTTGSLVPITASWAESASWASQSLSASWAPGALTTGGTYTVTASWALSASWAQNGMITASSYPITSSWADNTLSASWALNAVSYSVAFFTTQSMTSDFALLAGVAFSASYASQSATAISSMMADIAILAYDAVTSSYAYTASWALNAINGGTTLTTGSLVPITASWSQTASWALNAINGGTTLVTGSIVPITSSWSNTSSISLKTNNIYIDVDTSPDFQPIVFTQFDDIFPGYSVLHKSSASYNPFTDTIRITNFQGTASRAISASWAPAIPGGGGTTLYTGSTYDITASWAINSVFSQTADYSLDGLYCLTASYARHAESASYTILSVVTQSSFAQTASYVMLGRSVGLCYAFTPTGTGADVREVPVPFSPLDGTSSLTWNLKRIAFRAQTIESTVSSFNVEKHTGSGIFVATAIGSCTLSGGYFEAATTGSSLGSVSSGDKMRFNVTALGTATNWTIITELSNA